MHDIGKNLVKMMIEGTGLRVIDLGVDCDAEKVVQAVKDNNADIVCLSSLLTTTMMYQKDVIEALKAAGIRDQVKVMVGGAPLRRPLRTRSAPTPILPTRRARRKKRVLISIDRSIAEKAVLKLPFFI